jgi:uncharacterized SAM-binding protein YcdF (DUF218 family)
MLERETVQDFAVGPPYAPQWDRPRVSLWRALLVAALLLLLATAMIVGLALKYGASFLRVNNPERSDVMLVLGGGDDMRYQKALELRKAGYADKIILDAETIGERYGTNNFKLASEYVARTGVKDVTVCPVTHDSTYSETEDAFRCLAPLNASSVLIVTSDYHTRRAFDIFRSRLPRYHWSVAAAWAPLEGDGSVRMSSDEWWKNREWAKTVLEEWERLIWWNLVDRWKPHLVYQS